MGDVRRLPNFNRQALCRSQTPARSPRLNTAQAGQTFFSVTRRTKVSAAVAPGWSFFAIPPLFALLSRRFLTGLPSLKAGCAAQHGR
jgi:hypothetical protein